MPPLLPSASHPYVPYGLRLSLEYFERYGEENLGTPLPKSNITPPTMIKWTPYISTRGALE